MTMQAGVLVSPGEVRTRPTTGKAWPLVLNAANRSLGSPNLSDMNSSHDMKVFACSLAAVKLSDPSLKLKATKAILSAIGTEEEIRWLEIGRNFGGYLV